MKRPIVRKTPTETIVIYSMGRKVAKLALGRTIMDRVEDGFRYFTYGVTALFFAWMLISISGDLIGKALAEEMIVQFPVADNSMPPILRKIAKCEGVSQFDSKGKVTRGKVNKHDIGELQINEEIWGKKAKDLGFDIYTLEGNRAMGKWLLANYGSTKWKNSGACWAKLLGKK